MTRNEKLREILESAEENHREVTLIGKKFQLTGEVWYVYSVKDKVQIFLEGIKTVTVPFDVITTII